MLIPCLSPQTEALCSLPRGEPASFGLRIGVLWCCKLPTPSCPSALAICSRGRQDHSLPPSGGAARPPDEWKRLSRALGNWFSIASRLTKICFFPSASHYRWRRCSVVNWFLSPLSSSFPRTHVAATISWPPEAGGKSPLRCLRWTGCSGPVVSEPGAAGG